MTIRNALAKKPCSPDEDILELAARALSGDQCAFERIYREHVGRVFGICLRMLSNESQAEELTQRIFIRVWTKLNSFRGESSFSSWLYRLSVNTVLDELESTKWGNPKPFDSKDPQNAPEPTVIPLPEMHIDLERAVALLPTQARIVLVMHDIEGYKHEEIADVLGVTVGTTKAQLFRARRLLREALKS
jgi:RNA polymerase sigma-70 factor (ECF subfamily)